MPLPVIELIEVAWMLHVLALMGASLSDIRQPRVSQRGSGLSSFPSDSSGLHGRDVLALPELG
jgi:hypothetical protein